MVEHLPRMWKKVRSRDEESEGMGRGREKERNGGGREREGRKEGHKDGGIERVKAEYQ